MRIARVTGNLVSTIKEPTHTGRKLMLISYLGLDGNLDAGEYVYADAAGAGVGDTVLVCEEGSAAEVEFGLEGDVCVFDGVIVGVVDHIYID